MDPISNKPLDVTGGGDSHAQQLKVMTNKMFKSVFENVQTLATGGGTSTMVKDLDGDLNTKLLGNATSDRLIRQIGALNNCKTPSSAVKELGLVLKDVIGLEPGLSSSPQLLTDGLNAMSTPNDLQAQLIGFGQAAVGFAQMEQGNSSSVKAMEGDLNAVYTANTTAETLAALQTMYDDSPYS